jgi:hypothetical protein
MNKRIVILNLALAQCEKNLAKSEIRVQMKSDRLKAMNDSNSTVKRRSKMRADLSIECEQRDRWVDLIAEIEKWKGELK